MTDTRTPRYEPDCKCQDCDGGCDNVGLLIEEGESLCDECAGHWHRQDREAE